MASLTELQKIERKKLNIIASSVDSFLGQLEKSLSNLNAKIPSLLILDMDGNAIRSSQANLQRAIAARAQIVDLLDKTGFNKSIGGLAKTYNDVTALTAKGLAAAGIEQKFTRVDVRALTAVKEMDFRRWESFSNDLVDTVQNSIINSVVAGDKFSVMTDNIANTLTGLGEKESLITSRAATLANTYIQGFDRTVTARAAREADIDTFIYLGPDDDLTRPFCEDVLAGNGNMRFNIPAKNGDEPIYTLDEIEAMNNGTPLAPMNFGGGYNCRHKFRPISVELAKEIR